MAASIENLLDFSNWPATVPSPLAEAGNGIVLPVIAAMILGIVSYIVEYWALIRYPYEGPLALRPVIVAYRMRKAAIAMFVGLSGVEIRIFAVWVSRHLENHGTDPHSVFPAGLLPATFVFGTVLIFVGFTCWLRVTMPEKVRSWSITIADREIRLGRLIWPSAMIGCVAWGAWMAT